MMVSRCTSASGRFLPLAKGSNRPILLKKSAMVSAAEKYASEIEIFTFGRGFRTQISHSSVQKRRFHQSMIRPFGRTDFFNRIGQYLPDSTGRYWSISSRSIASTYPSTHLYMAPPT
ncbi:hypothetical protein CES87_16210 [Pseudomonas sp. ERMR1:02]|nr:hypothetical protein CES87_16210 [Pseudomonas sp. ERMR1:02]